MAETDHHGRTLAFAVTTAAAASTVTSLYECVGESERVREGGWSEEGTGRLGMIESLSFPQPAVPSLTCVAPRGFFSLPPEPKLGESGGQCDSMRI